MKKAIIEALLVKPMTLAELQAKVKRVNGVLVNSLTALLGTGDVVRNAEGKFQLELNLLHAHIPEERGEYVSFVVAAFSPRLAKEAILYFIGASVVWEGSSPTYDVIGTTTYFPTTTIVSYSYQEG